jgi:hypothetical protein
MQISPKLFQTALQHNFSNFIRRCFETINPGIDYKPNWHIDLIADELETVENGDIKRLMINMPPRALKSVCGIPNPRLNWTFNLKTKLRKYI